MKDLLLRVIGWKALLFHHDFTVYDRYRWLRRHTQTRRRILDAGCGVGAFTMFAGTRASHAVGLTVSEPDALRAERRARIAHLPHVQFEVIDLRRIEQFADRLGTFDEIWCLEVIEHLVNDEDIFKQLATLLEPDGRLLLTTPSAGYVPMYGDKISVTEDGGHVRWGYTPQRLHEMAEAADLHVCAIEFVTGRLSQMFTNWYRRLTERFGQPVAWLVVLPLRPLVIFDALVTRVTRYPQLSIAMIAARPSRLSHITQ